MYDRSLDFNIPAPKPRSYFGLPIQEIYYFYSDLNHSWAYELIDNCAFDLDQLNRDHGKVKLITNSDLVEECDILFYLEQKYPNAHINMYQSEEDWLADLDYGCRY
jgi:hypothetical protein